MKSLVSEKLLKAYVTGITWERVHLFLDVRIEFSEKADKCAPLDFYAVNLFYETMLHFKAKRTGETTYRLHANVTNRGDKSCIPTGTYRIFVCQGDYKLADCEADVSVVSQMEEMSRNFLYGGMGKVYTVTFYVEEGGENLPFRFRALASSRTGIDFPKNPGYFASLHPIKNFIKCYLGSSVVLRRAYRFFSLFPHKKKTILFLTEHSKVLKSNLKAVYERMLARGMEKEYRLLVSARTGAAEPQPKISWIKLMKKLAESDLIFIDDHVPVFDKVKLKESTKVVQLWHAGAGFKSSGYSRWGHMGCPGPSSCHRQYQYGIAGSRNIAPFFSEVWGINDELVLPTGMPRMDEYLNEAHKKKKTEELYKEYPMCKGKKVMLFAPTYRGMNQPVAYYPYEMIDFDRLYRECGDEYVVLFKAHPWVNNTLKIPKKYKDKFLDVKNYPDINDLFYITDLLITDYSSNIFEFSLMRKPMMFFAYDKIQYSFSRGFHRDYEEAAPGKVCYTFEQLMDAFAARDFEYEKVEQYIKHHFDYIDSNSSDRVIDWIVLDLLPEDIRAKIEEEKADMERTLSLNFTPELIGEEVDTRAVLMGKSIKAEEKQEENDA